MGERSTTNSIQIDLFNFESETDDHPDQEFPAFDVFFPARHQRRRRAQGRRHDDRRHHRAGRRARRQQGSGDGPAARTCCPRRASATTTTPTTARCVSSGTSRGTGSASSRWRAGSRRWRPGRSGGEKRGGVVAWQWQDLVVAPHTASEATQKFAQQRADALNDPRTADQVNDALDQSYSSLLVAIEASWKNAAWRNRKGSEIDADQLFPYAAMQALSTRVAAVWAANGVPRFKEGADLRHAALPETATARLSGARPRRRSPGQQQLRKRRDRHLLRRQQLQVPGRMRLPQHRR